MGVLITMFTARKLLQIAAIYGIFVENHFNSTRIRFFRNLLLIHFRHVYQQPLYQFHDRGV